MATERLAPDAVLASLNYTTLNLADVDEDPDSPDANYGAWDTNGNTDARFSFPTPSGSPTVGAGLQEFRVLIRRNGATTNTGWSLELFENGASVSVLATGTLTNTTPVVVSGTWNASSLGTATGALVECRMLQTSGGTGGTRSGVEVGAVEWNVTYTAPVTGSATVDAVIRRTQTGSFTANAVIKRTTTMSPSNWRSNGNHNFNTSIRKVDYDGTYWVAVAYANVGFHILSYATDPEQAWTENTSLHASSGAFDLYWVKYANGVWVAVGRNNSDDADVWTTTDPTGTWTQNATSFGGSDLKCVTYAQGTWVAVGNAGIWTATDPTGTWTKNNNSNPFGDPHCVEYANGYWVASGIDTTTPPNGLGEIAYTTDPTTAWTAATWDSSETWPNSGMYSIHYANGYWVVGGYWTDTNKIAVATDPTGTWTNYETAFIDDVDLTDKNGNAGVYSSEGHTWVISGGWDHGTGVKGHIQYGSPPSNWTKARDDGGSLAGIQEGMNLVRVFYAAGRWVACGDSASVPSELSEMFTTREYLASAVIKRTQAGSFTADAVVITGGGTVTGNFTADARADLVGVPVWVEPANEAPIGLTPTFVLTIPQAVGKVWFHLQLDRAATFDSEDLRDLKTSASVTGWEYWDGDSWEPLPSTGLTGGFTQVRYTVSPPLASGTWYRRVRAGTTR